MDGQGYPHLYRDPNAPNGGHPNAQNGYLQQHHSNGYYSNQSVGSNGRNQVNSGPYGGGVGHGAAPHQPRAMQSGQFSTPFSASPRAVATNMYAQSVRHHHVPPQQHYHQLHQPTQFVSKFTLSPNAQEFVPNSFSTPRDYQFAGAQSSSHHDTYASNSYSNDDDDDAHLQLQMFITDVTLSPAMYESRVYDVSDVIQQELKRTPQKTEQIVATIFQAGLLQTNFRYSGARLSDYLSTLPIIPGKQIFLDELFAQLHRTVTTHKPVTGEKELDKDNRGIALFCAELFKQLDMGYTLEVPSRYEDVGRAYAAILEALIGSNEKENQKNAIHALKLCGAHLEQLCKGSDAMDRLLETCKTIEENEKTDQTIKLMLSRLPQTRKANWGYFPRERSFQDYGHTRVDNNQMPVMYGPDGQPLSADELGFLTSSANEACGFSNSHNDYSESYPSQSIMDEEALDAYEQFLQETGQN